MVKRKDESGSNISKVDSTLPAPRYNLDVVYAKHHKVKESFPTILRENNGLVYLTCKKVGIDRSTFYDWCDKDPLFAKDCEEAREAVGDKVEDKLYELIEEKNPQAVMFYCKTRLKNRGYVERSEVDNTHKLKHEDALEELR